MNRRPSRSTGGALLVLVLFLLPAACSPAPGEASGNVPLPEFEVDPTWPQPLPDEWILGAVSGIAVDGRGHVWVVSAPSWLTPREVGAIQDPPLADCCTPAPPLIEFDREGNVVQSWEGPGEGYEWPEFPHGVFVDHDDFVWVGSHSHHQILKFTRSGEHVLTIGELDSTGGSNDPARLGSPAGIWVDPETNQVYVADGYANRRVVVFDGDTGRYLRHWGAYGERPDDEYTPGPRGADAPPSRQFSTVHGIAGSRDGLIYVADRANNRIQAFRRDGTFQGERIVAPATLASGSAFDVALSPDPDQRFLYLADGTNHRIWVLERQGLEIVGRFGRGGRQAGQLLRPHNIDTDSEGNLYLTEADTWRIQRFMLRTPLVP